MSFKSFVKKQYRAIMRMIPNELAMKIDYLRGYGEILDLKDPKTFGAKIQWIKLYGNLERYADLVDKYKVRYIISKSIGEEYLPELYGVYSDANDIDFTKLPNKFVIKCNHGCGYNIVCKDKDKIDIVETQKILSKWMKEEFYKNAKEIQYKNIIPTITCEEYLEDKAGALLDYKYFCFDGKAEFVQVVSDRGIDTRSDFYDLNWNFIDLRTKLKNSDKKFNKPKNLEKMNVIAEVLSKDYPFVRVDFYNVEGRIVFGELTFTPGGGVSKFRPIEKDYEISKRIDINKYRENKGE